MGWIWFQYFRIRFINYWTGKSYLSSSAQCVLLTLCPGKLRTALQTAAQCSEHQCSPSCANSSEGNMHPKPFQLLSSPFQSPSSAIPIACAIGGSILFILIILVWKREYPQANGSNAGLMHMSSWVPGCSGNSALLLVPVLCSFYGRCSPHSRTVAPSGGQGGLVGGDAVGGSLCKESVPSLVSGPVYTCLYLFILSLYT